MKRPSQIRPEDSLTILGMESADQDRAQAIASLTAEALAHYAEGKDKQ